MPPQYDPFSGFGNAALTPPYLRNPYEDPGNPWSWASAANPLRDPLRPGPDPLATTRFPGLPGEVATSSTMPAGGIPGIQEPVATGSQGYGLGGMDKSTAQGWGKVAGAGIGLLSTLLAPKGIDLGAPTAEAYGAARGLQSQGRAMVGQGADVLAPTIRYLSQLQSGDPSQILAAIMPERRRVLDQYDTARQATRFQPRSGGTASAMTDLGGREASDLAMLAPEARSRATALSAQLGTSLSGQGLTAEVAGARSLEQLLQQQQAQKAQEDQQTWKTYEGIGSLAITLLPLLLSDRDAKESIEPVETSVLDLLQDLPVSTWRYKGDPTTHIGPMAQDLHEILGVGDGKTISLVDVAGIMIQALKELGERQGDSHGR